MKKAFLLLLAGMIMILFINAKGGKTGTPVTTTTVTTVVTSNVSSDSFISLIQKNYKQCQTITLMYLNGLIPAIIPIKVEKITSLTISGDVMKLFYKEKDSESTEFYQSLNGVYNVMIVKNPKKGDTMFIFFGETKFSKELSNIISEKYKNCQTLTYMNPTLNCPIPIKVDNIGTLAVEGDVLHMETKDNWSIYQAISGLNYIIYRTSIDKNNVSKSNIILFNFGKTNSKTIGNSVAARYKECGLILPFNIFTLPPIPTKDLQTVGVNNGIINLEYKKSGNLVYQSLDGLKNVTIKSNNMLLTF
ncbi:MAG: hypothetical protein A2086_07715 [Spirochaetes bacterium GWD1_27_9]|nr:MAG: hypothetical protein A2Z98_05845 [Spirochaetes bacterium GWB1_27_13]OHD20747.1 MAG: hypothetical protein A2Y34_00605 [Spirochaetes bacterium GWC1_27_15]OHD34366.1 MAG: hypothetical protein A2086_07715 [Spirochaetes bacterium GWD1_27_9]